MNGVRRVDGLCGEERGLRLRVTIHRAHLCGGDVAAAEAAFAEAEVGSVARADPLGLTHELERRPGDRVSQTFNTK